MANFKNEVAPWIGMLAIAGFAVLLLILLSHTSDAELPWSRKVYLFGAVEAVALAAVGYFFGKDVHRERAEQAENRAEAAQVSARTAEEKRSGTEQKLTDLINYIETKSAGRSNVPVVSLDELTELARKSGGQISLPDLAGFKGKGSPGVTRSFPTNEWEELSRYAQTFVTRK
jgi:hypothetical protein